MKKILVIDDDELMNKSIVHLLSEAGYEAQGALDGNSGLHLLKMNSFDLIVTDIVMPEKEGLETIMAIREISKTLPIIAISGGGKRGQEVYLQTAREFGANFAFQKPFNTEKFLEAVRECLAGI